MGRKYILTSQHVLLMRWVKVLHGCRHSTHGALPQQSCTVLDAVLCTLESRDVAVPSQQIWTPLKAVRAQASLLVLWPRASQNCRPSSWQSGHKENLGICSGARVHQPRLGHKQEARPRPCPSPGALWLPASRSSQQKTSSVPKSPLFCFPAAGGCGEGPGREESTF